MPGALRITMSEPIALDWFDRAAARIALLGFGGLVIVAVLTSYDGAARTLSWPRFSGFTDYGRLVYPIVIASCFPIGLMRRNHLSIRVLGNRLGAGPSAWLDTLAALFTLGFFVLMAWQLTLMTFDLAAADRITPTIELAEAPWWMVATGVILACVVLQLLVTAQLLISTVRARALPEPGDPIT